MTATISTTETPIKQIFGGENHLTPFEIEIYPFLYRRHPGSQLGSMAQRLHDQDGSADLSSMDG
ncbi:MAG: hypothetical protein RLY31_89 [Bacteroidota bacterium]